MLSKEFGSRGLDFSSADQRFLVLRLVIGIGLLLTAGLKTHGVVVDPVFQGSFLAPLQLQVAVIELEILLGLWLLSGRAKPALWLCALCFFLVAAATNFYLGWAGRSSCGCFGRVHVNPWVTFALDVALVVCLLFCKPVWGKYLGSYWCLADIVKTIAGTAVVLIVVVGIFLAVADNPAALLARLRGEPIVVYPVLSDVGAGSPGQSQPFRIELTNFTDERIRIIGGTTNCSCIATQDLPVAIPAGDRRSITVVMTYSGSPGSFQQRFILYTDYAGQPFVRARFAGRVKEPSNLTANILGRQ